MNLHDPRESGASRTVIKSLGLNVLLDKLECDRSYSVLDLGPALEENVRFWSQFSCRLYIQDLYRSFRDWKAAVEPEDRSEVAAFRELLPFSDETVFDIILAWDIFNYFDLRELKAIVQRLSRWCRQGTKLFMLISDLPNIPESPTLFRILDKKQMIHEIPTQEKMLSPRHQPRDIAMLMARFTVSSSFLLRHGLQEYVFEFKQKRPRSKRESR